MEIKVAVIEDTDDAFISIKQCLNQYSKTTNYTFNITRYTYSESFLENYKSVFDIVIMDIMLPGMNGMDAAGKLRSFDPKVPLVFVTNMSQYAIKGYDVDALGYILKPVSYHSFALMIEKALRRLDKPRQGQMLRLRTESGVRLIETANIYYIDIFAHDMTTHLAREKISSYGILSEVEKQLINDGFVRCSACSLVNLRYVDGIYGDDVKLKNGVSVHIGRTKKKEFMTAFGNYIVGGKIS